MIDRPFYKTRAKANLHGKWIVAALIAVVLMIALGEEVINFDMYSENPVNFEQVDQNSVNDAIGYLPMDNALWGLISNVTLPVVTFLFFPIVLLVIAAGLALQAFVMGPLSLGAYRYFRQNDLGEERAEISELLWAFRSPHYMNMVKVLFLMGLKLLGWFLLLIIPGIIKSFEYSMIPYILIRDPGTPSHEVFALTRELTMGRKGALFVLGLSFIGWYLLGSIPFGLGIPFVRAYETQTKAGIFNDWIGDTRPMAADAVY